MNVFRMGPVQRLRSPRPQCTAGDGPRPHFPQDIEAKGSPGPTVRAERRPRAGGGGGTASWPKTAQDIPGAKGADEKVSCGYTGTAVVLVLPLCGAIPPPRRFPGGGTDTS